MIKRLIGRLKRYFSKQPPMVASIDKKTEPIFTYKTDNGATKNLRTDLRFTEKIGKAINNILNLTSGVPIENFEQLQFALKRKNIKKDIKVFSTYVNEYLISVWCGGDEVYPYMSLKYELEVIQLLEIILASKQTDTTSKNKYLHELYIETIKELQAHIITKLYEYKIED